LVVTEELTNNSFGRALNGLVQEKYYDAPVIAISSEHMPALPLNLVLEQTIISTTEKVKMKIKKLLYYFELVRATLLSSLFCFA